LLASAGAGITGLTTALLLKREGIDVLVVEADRIGSGVTGHTTGKLTAGHGLTYSKLEEQHGADTARAYAEAQVGAVELVFDLVDELGVECELERTPDYVYATNREQTESLEAELEASRRAGLSRVLERGRGQPVPSAVAALRLSDQGQLHARKYALALAQLVHGDDCAVVEGTRVVDVEPGPTMRLVTEHGDVHADHVVLATNAPITSRGLFFARVHPWRAYAVAAPAPGLTLAGTWINAGTPIRSLRTAPLEDGTKLLIVVGEGHRVGQEEDTRHRYAALAEFVRGHFSGLEPSYRWSTQDQYSVDGLPYVGRVGDDGPGLFVATGFGGWGLTNGTAAALVIRDSIVDRPNSWAPIVDPNRGLLTHAPGSLLRENVNVARQLVGGRLRERPHDPDAIEPGDGAVLEIDGRKAAVYRDDAGALHAVSATCTHMGCLVEWNAAERTWDCPCHGSRFTSDGAVLHGPAATPLEPVDTPAGVVP
jgi:glycine/D-amino acid oxidase-like deaminating enzyme/nitrite reductase/ring-hydroxylating ferredoxin subunit